MNYRFSKKVCYIQISHFMYACFRIIGKFLINYDIIRKFFGKFRGRVLWLKIVFTRFLILIEEKNCYSMVIYRKKDC